MIHLLTGGIEWAIESTRYTCDQLPEPGNIARIFVLLYHREDSMKMFGFSSQEERCLFLSLIKVDGVGPKLAQKILSSAQPANLMKAIQSEDLPFLESIPGLGKKTAQKLLLNLRGKILHDDTQGEASIVDDLVPALAGMGFDKKKAREAVLQADKELGNTARSSAEHEQEVLKLAIKLLGKERAK